MRARVPAVALALILVCAAAAARTFDERNSIAQYSVELEEGKAAANRLTGPMKALLTLGTVEELLSVESPQILCQFMALKRPHDPGIGDPVLIGARGVRAEIGLTLTIDSPAGSASTEWVLEVKTSGVGRFSEGYEGQEVIDLLQPLLDELSNPVPNRSFVYLSMDGRLLNSKRVSFLQFNCATILSREM